MEKYANRIAYQDSGKVRLVFGRFWEGSGLGREEEELDYRSDSKMEYRAARIPLHISMQR